MRAYRFLSILTVLGLLLAGCTPQSVPSPAPAVQATQAQPAALAATETKSPPAETQAMPSFTATAKPSPTAVPTIQTYTTKPDDKSMARLRVSNCINAGDSVEVYFDGKKLDNGGVPIKVPAPQTSGYWYLPPGKTSLTVAPVGKGSENALIGPLDVSMEAGHRYTIVVLGMRNDPKHDSLVIDETEAYQKAGVTPTTTGHILVNNVKGSTSIDFIADNDMGNHNVAYGDYQAARIPTGYDKTFIITMKSATDKVVGDNSGDLFASQLQFLDCFTGPDIYHADTSSSRSDMELNPIDFMKSYPDDGGNHTTYTQFLKLIDLAGMTDLLANGGPFLIYAPNDQAFSKVPKEKLAPYFNDPQKAAEFVKYHVIEGFYPVGSIYSWTEASDRTLVNMLGKEIKIYGRHGVGRAQVDAEDGMTPNGTRFCETPTILMPMDQ